MMATMKAQLPKDIRLQCPGCGAPVTVVELKVRRDPYLPTGLFLEDCGHVVSLELIRDAWGIDIPEPDPMRVTLLDP